MREETRFEHDVALALATVIAAVVLAFVLPAVASAAPSVDVSDGRLSVVGDPGQDNIEVSDVTDPDCPGGSPCYQVDAGWEYVVVTPPCVVKPPAPSAVALCPPAGVTAISIVGREGYDALGVAEFAFGLAVPTVIEGGPDEDRLVGSDLADRLVGESGDDDLNGRKGNDLLLGGAGEDRLDGARGNDRLVGHLGPDHLIGGTNRDLLFGLAGNDILDGQQGRDGCYGGTGQDRSRNCERRRRIP